MSETYKDTLNLPNTAFPMKANLSQREPEILKKWQELDLYKKIQQKNKDKDKFIFHNGPPYANGSIHIGHAINYTLKDMVVKSKLLSGYRSPFVPGWDCHGLPVELNVEKKIGKPGDKIDFKTFRKKCREYVEEQVKEQRSAFIRLGVLADWQHPYLTMDFSYEADIIRSLAKVIGNGYLHKGYKPVHWCIDCASALAEAEVEYKDKTSPAIDVSFRVKETNKLPFKKEAIERIENLSLPVSVVIWTTTPWTLPANEAVALHPEHYYVLVYVPSKKECFIVMRELLESIAKRGFANEATSNEAEADPVFELLDVIEGKALEGVMLRHPFYDREVPIVLGEHVTLDAGTGAVHTAPAHGVEDFEMGKKYNLPLFNPVGSNGCFLPGTPLLAGEHVFKANKHVIEILKEHGTLLHEGTLQHSYPHCWRHKSPLIFRATQQWFIGMDQVPEFSNLGAVSSHKGNPNTVRAEALAAIQTVKWIPAWGQARIEGMIEGRPDWCISRQRTWGVPLCLFLHKETGNLHPNTPELMEKVAKCVEKTGIDAWYDLSLEDLLGEEAQQYEKSTDTLDVWFDSGVSHFCVLERRPELSFPADLYLEGSDQHRGWFHSSLLSSIAMNGQAPYRQVLTHGFVVDSDGYKMSKSLGNVVAPDKVVNSLGADVLRLWVSATDYRAEIPVSEEILKRTSDIYRRIRNTARFLLANLNGFDPAQHRVSANEMLALDRFIVHRATQVQIDIIEAFNDYQFNLVYQKLHNFCSIDLGSFYLDIIKDRQYTGKAAGIPRRSAQTALYYIVEALVRWMAPILTFTAEEVWQYLPGKREDSVFLSEWYSEFPDFAAERIMNDAFWQQILECRDVVNKALEEARVAGLIGSGLEAEVELYCAPKLYELLSQLGNELRFVLITSEANIYRAEDKPVGANSTSNPELWLVVKASPYTKCDRCWHRREDVDKNSAYPGLCARCIENITEGSGEIRHYA